MERLTSKGRSQDSFSVTLSLSEAQAEEFVVECYVTAELVVCSAAAKERVFSAKSHYYEFQY